MRNLSLKDILKIALVEQQLKDKNFVAITYNNPKKQQNIKRFKLPREQFISNKISELVDLKNMKFPLEVSIFLSEKELKMDKNNKGGILKIKNNVFTKKNDIDLYSITSSKIYNRLFGIISPDYLFNLIENTKENKPQ